MTFKPVKPQTTAERYAYCVWDNNNNDFYCPENKTKIPKIYTRKQDAKLHMSRHGIIGGKWTYYQIEGLKVVKVKIEVVDDE